MGLNAKGKQFCDLCCKTHDSFDKKVSFYRCGKCPEEKRPLLCVGCVTLHYRNVHPSLYMEILMPRVKEHNEAEASR